MGIMRCAMFLLAIATISCASVLPIYSSQYSHVRYQGVTKTSQQKDKEQSSDENLDIFENSTPLGDIASTSDYLIPNDITVEPESEQVDFIFFPNENANIELLDDVEDSNEETNTELAEVDPKPQEMYYILHPNGLLRKVVYIRNNKDEIGQLQFGNPVPIIEPVFTYDPSTFVFQRLQLFSG
ncbi:uncharacterized protein [Leptinotarsa decemlineata]|uniref:uncharacterized protein n=1 Tax=Leptinotarsa decemlineata TaxID=7539 RepID=UPI000C254C46|nr:uncharacterized protein LOC111514738 [Leptinotarsa decemlineata]